MPGSWRSPVAWPRRRSSFAVAAEQYLPVVDEVDDPTERRRVVALLRQAADQARLIGDYALVNALLTAALRLVDPADGAAVLDVRTGRHAALFSLGRLDEADEDYRSIAELGADRIGPGGRDGSAGAQPQPPDPFCRGHRARP